MFFAPDYFANKKRLIGFISCYNDKFKFIIMDSVTEKLVKFIDYRAVDAGIFIDQISLFHKNMFKAIIVDLFGLNMVSTIYKISFKFCEKLKESFNRLKISSYFITEENYLFSTFLCFSQIESHFGDTVLIVMPGKQNGLAPQGTLMVGAFKYTPKGYQFIDRNRFIYDSKMKPETCFQQICGSSNPQKIIVAALKCKKIPIKKIFKSKNVVFLNFDVVPDYRHQFIFETCKWLFDKSYVKFHILPICAKSVHLYGNFGSDKNLMDIAKININDQLPATIIQDVTKCIPELQVMYENENMKVGFVHELPKKCHGYRINLKLDEENFDHINVETYNLQNVIDLPSRMNVLLKSKVPFIAFFQNLSAIGIYQESKGYEYLEAWNGVYGTDCFISFDEKKPKFGQTAMDTLKTKNTFVVFDLLKIMSMPSENIKIDKIWGFTFTKDDNNPVLLEFDNFDGTKKASSPSFLMALLIKQQLKAMKAEIGEKPKQIALWIYRQNFNEGELKRIKDGLKESCRLLKIDVYFVNAEYCEVDFVKFCPKNLA